MLILFLLVITGCSINTGEEDNSSEAPSVPGFIHINQMEYDILSGGYSWEKKQGNDMMVVQTDHAGPVQMAEDFDAIMIDQGETIFIDIIENPLLQVFIWHDSEKSEEVMVSDNQITAPESEGQHIYEVVATWENGEIAGWERGEVSYTFVVDVE